MKLGNEQGARELIRGNKDIFQKGESLQQIRSDVKNWQDMREQVANHPQLTNEQKQRVLKRIDKEIKNRLELLNRF